MIVLLVLSTIPVAISVWALLDAARRPAWVWSLAEKSQLGWLVAIVFGIFVLVLGVVVSIWYLLRVRPVLRDIENGDLDRLQPEA